MPTAWLVAAVLLAGPPPPPDETPLERAERAFMAGDYARASAGFAEAYAADPNPRFLYAQAQSERLAGNCPRALQLYDQFLRLDPAKESADDARANRTRCVDAVPKARAKAEPPPQGKPGEPATTSKAPKDTRDPPAPTGRPWYRDPWGGALVGSGLFVGGIGIGLLVSAARLDAEAPDAPNEGAYETTREDAVLRNQIGIGTTAFGGALVVGGIVRWAVVGARKSRRVAVGFDGRALVLRGRF
jgi:tetratricopeptide (TPR) repeat protein